MFLCQAVHINGQKAFLEKQKHGIVFFSLLLGMRILVMLLLDTLPMLGNVLLLCFFVFFIFGIIGVQLWAGLLRQRCHIPEGQAQYIIKSPYYEWVPNLISDETWSFLYFLRVKNLISPWIFLLFREIINQWISFGEGLRKEINLMGKGTK